MAARLPRKGNRALAVLALVALLYSMLLVASARPSGAAPRCYSGTGKGLWYNSEGWHHYVEFRVDASLPDSEWYIQATPPGFPFGTSIWPGYYQRQHNQGGPALYKEVGYRWWDNWWDPYPASGWVICQRS